MKEPRNQEFRSILSVIVDSETFSGQARSRQLLTHLVEQKLAGNERDLKGYSIGLDVFGRPSDFDPSADPIVRVQMGRLRSLLEKYYLTDGVEDDMRIVLPKGSYVPVFQMPEIGPATPESASRITAKTAPMDAARRRSLKALRPRYLRTRPQIIAGLLVAAVMGFAASFFFGRTDVATNPADPQLAPVLEEPVILVLPFENLSPNSNDAVIAKGIRRQLIVDLSRFKSFRVRDGGQLTGRLDANEPSPKSFDFALHATFLRTAQAIQLAVTLNQSSNDTLLWGDTVQVEANDSGIQELMFEMTRSIVSRIAASSGPLQTEILKVLRSRKDRFENARSSEFECTMRYYSFDLTKSETEGKQAKNCLVALVENESQNSAVWAAYASLQFFDWTKLPKGAPKDLLENAVASARKAIQLDPNDPAGHEALAAIKLAQGDHEEAKRYYESALTLNPSKADLHVQMGWQMALQGNWETGILKVKEGVALSLAPPGWFLIPLSLDAFRREDYREAFFVAKNIVETGDRRGIVLALAAAAKLNDADAIDRYKNEFLKRSDAEPTDPLKEIRNIFNDPKLLARYRAALSKVGFTTLEG